MATAARKPPAKLTAAEIAAASTVTADDFRAARVLWRRAVPKRLAKLLDAGKR